MAADGETFQAFRGLSALRWETQTIGQLDSAWSKTLLVNDL